MIPIRLDCTHEACVKMPDSPKIVTTEHVNS